MKNSALTIILTFTAIFGTFAQDNKPKKVKTNVKSEKHVSSTILLWMRTDKPRQSGMDHWKGSHAQIIAANPGLLEYRQIHFNENNIGLWPTITGVQTSIPLDRKIDGVADVTLKSLFAATKGKEQHKLAFADEVNFLKRSLLYVAFPKSY